MAQTAIKTADLNTVLNLGIFKGLDGRSFCQTGKMSVSRQQLEGIITWLGGLNHSAIKSTTNVLITNNGDVKQGSKYRAAMAQGIMIITEQEFCEMILPSVDELRGNSNEGSSY